MKVRLLKSLEPICYNLKKWNISESPVLLITGLSGSGKTTFAKKIAKHNHAICISFDVLKFYPESSKQSQKILDIFLKKHPEIKKNIYTRWAQADKINSNDILFNYYCNVFFDFIIEYSQQHKKKIVLEGIQMFVRLHPSRSIEMPIIIIRSSSVKCFFNKLKRDYPKNMSQFKVKFIEYMIRDFYIYHIKQRKLLNIYNMYLFSVNKILPKEIKNE